MRSDRGRAAAGCATVPSSGGAEPTMGRPLADGLRWAGGNARNHVDPRHVYFELGRFDVALDEQIAITTSPGMLTIVTGLVT